MAEINITQAEAETLLTLEKHRVDERVWTYPMPGTKVEIPLVSLSNREDFILDLSRQRIDISKVKYQNRARKAVVLARLDLGGKPHTNPIDLVQPPPLLTYYSLETYCGKEIPSPHLHLYVEGYGDKWAFPLDSSLFTCPSDVKVTLNQFMDFCKITKSPHIQWTVLP